MGKTLSELWGPTLADRMAAKLDFRVFDKPGIYLAVILVPSGAWSTAEQKGYARDEEIKEAEKEYSQYVKKERDHIAQLRSKGEKAREWAGWLDAYKTPEKVFDAINAWEDKLDALERANTPTEMLKASAQTHSPGMRNQRKLMFGETGWRIAQRAHRAEEAGEAGPAAILRLTGMGVILADMPDWGKAAEQTSKALGFVKTREKAMMDAIGSEMEKLRNGAVAMAEQAIKDALAKYPLADPGRLPTAERLAPMITLSRK